jgi:protein-S-isoprenylcysteine O-methyltransferase Ste14
MCDALQNAFVGKAKAAAGTFVFLVLVPGVVAGVVPWSLTGWRAGDAPAYWLPFRLAGWILVVAGVIVLLQAFARFVVEGLGTPAPVAPTQRLVVGGLYRYVRNPMYLAVGGVIVGQALVLARPILLPYAAAYGAAVVLFVRAYEEPTLRRRFGESYGEYRRAVPAWWPRRTPWRPDGDERQPTNARLSR